jgi:hypothetical protein
MKSKTILALILLSLVSLLSAGDYIIGTGTSTENYVPLYGYSNYGWSKFFFTSDELAAAGMSGTVTLTKLAFKLGNTTPLVNYVTDEQWVYFRYFYDSTYASAAANYPGTTSFTLVYHGSITWNGPGWVEIPLDTPYDHNSAWGIEILWENRDGSKTAGPPKFCYTSTSGNYRAVYKYSDSSFPTTSGTRYYNRPNIWFMSPPTDVPPPANVVSPADGATDVEINSSLVWNHAGGDPDHYRLWLGSDDPPSNLLSAWQTTASSYTPVEYLEYSTTYYWRVVPHNDFGYALDCPVWSFTTRADPSITAFPWLESFDGTFNPDGWTDHAGGLVDPITLGTDGSSLWQQDDWLNISSTDKAAKINIWGAVSGWLISPLLNIPDGYCLEFDAALLRYGQPPTGNPPQYTGTDDRFAVLIGDGFSWSTADIVREWNNAGSPYVLNEIPVDGARYRIPLDGFSGRKRIAFYAGSTETNADNDFMLNNVEVKQLPLDAPLLEITVDHVLNQLTLSWDAVPGAAVYQIYKASAPDGSFNLLDSTSATQYQLSPAEARAFFRVVASSTTD